MNMTIKLNAPGMTSLHKAGLAGLYLTLKAFEEKQETINGLTWKLETEKIILEWSDNNLKSTFQNLINRSFRLDENGFIVLTGLEISQPLKIEQKYHLYIALLNSFLQFGPHRPTNNKRILSYEVDDHFCWIKDFAPIKKFRHQQADEDFIDNTGQFNKSIETSGWLYPGGGQRHVEYNNTKINETTELALALLFAPVGVIYFTIKSRIKGRKARLAMLLPEITNLEEYAEIRQILTGQNVLDLTASSSSDAALRMIILIEAHRTSKQFSKFSSKPLICRIVTFGIVSWNEKQKSRTYSRTVVSNHLSESALKNYRKAEAIFKNRWQLAQGKYDRNGEEIEPERYFITSFSAREFIADNIAQGKVWYHDITTSLSHKEFREQLLYERKELYKMLDNAVYDDENERLFISICHESWRRRLGKLGKRAISENTNFQTLIKKESEKLRTSLIRCKNSETLRETVVDFWSRAGVNESLRGKGLSKVLPLFDKKNWKKTRDLALLALISYQPQNKEEIEALTDVPTHEEGKKNE